MSTRYVNRMVRIEQTTVWELQVDVPEDATDEEVERRGLEEWGTGDFAGQVIDSWTGDLSVRPYNECEQDQPKIRCYP